MKKLLIVLLVVALASFLFVGCLPTTPEEPTEPTEPTEPEEPTEPTVTIAVTNEYTDTGGKTYVPSGTDVDVTVTFTEAVEADYIVYIAKKTVKANGDIEYTPAGLIEATPNADRTIWTVEDVDFLDADGIKADECEAFCLVAIVKHPCCPGEEVALKVVTPDCTEPVIPTFAFKCYDCNACEEDVCEPEGAYFTFTSVVTDEDPCTADKDSCKDACSGVGTWSFKIDPDGCNECVLAVGSGCPVEGTADCGCLPWATSGEVTYDVVFTIADNVGNENTATYQITVDTDSVVTCMKKL